MNAQINIDDFVDYSAEYKRYIPNGKVQGNRFIGKCPFHADDKDSFTADIKTGMCHCFAGCIDGNYVSFYGKINGLDNKTAYKQILSEYGKLEEPKAQSEQNKEVFHDLTLQEYSLMKRLPEDFLKNTCFVSSVKDYRSGVKWIKMPYLKEDGTYEIFRKRYGEKRFLWNTGSAGKLCLYGLWRMNSIREAGYAVLVEGESDTQTLWYLGISALGTPGASNFRRQMAKGLEEIKLYIHVEPDKGGETFLNKVTKALIEAEFPCEVYMWSCKEHGVKDPSELYLKYGEEDARKRIQDSLSAAKKIDLTKISEIIPEAIKGAPVNLRQPNGWIFSEYGISKIDEKTMVPSIICRTPIILTKRLRAIDSDEEKIEIAFKRDDKWHTAVFPRSTIFTSRSITCLADLGCTVTSENAKNVVKFLSALEAENFDVISKADSTSTFGWQSGGRFLPGYGDDIVLDIEPSLKGWAAAYHTNGSYEGWLSNISEHRVRDKFRFILAAGFVAPLLRIISQRIFIVYNWGSSKSGKTAGLKAALSAWGNPEKLMVNFNATQVALERMAGFYCDLPMGIDERQLAGKNQDGLEKIVYMIASGTGRARGSKGGGLQALNTWRTVALATGEEPLSTETSQTGVSSRVLEVYGGPFENERQANLMHQQSVMDYGFAGPKFIGKLLKTDEKSIQLLYHKMLDDVYKLGGEISGSHVTSIASVALADAMLETWLFSSEEPLYGEASNELIIRDSVWKRSLDMAKTIINEQMASAVEDVNETATQFIVDWIYSNEQNFGDRAVGTSYGILKEDKAYIYPSILTTVLTRAGFSPRKTLKYLHDNGIISATEFGGKIKYSVVKWFGTKNCRFVEFDLSRFQQKSDENQFTKRQKNLQRQLNFDDFEPVSAEELPF